MSFDFRLHLALAILSVLVIGCGRGNSDGMEAVSAVRGVIRTNSSEITYADLNSDAKLVVVGTKFLTKREIEDRIGAFSRKLQRERPNDAARFLKEGKEKFPAVIIAQFLNEAAFELESDERNIQPTPEYLEQGWNNISNVCRALKKTYKQFCAEFPGGETGLEKTIVQNARNKVLFDVLFTNSLDVSDAEVEKLHADLVRKNADATVTNRALVSEMSLLRQKMIKDRISFGDDDEKNAKLLPHEYSVEVFGERSVKGFEDEELVPGILSAAKKGVWTEPVELESTIEMFLITNVVRRSSDKPTLYSGVRVFREKDLGYLVPEKERLKDDLRRRRNLQIVAPMSEKLQKKFGVIYPYGFPWERDVLKSDKRQQKGDGK